MEGMRCLEKPRDRDYREERSQQPDVLSVLHACSPSEIENSGFWAESPISTLTLPENDTLTLLSRQARGGVTSFRRGPRRGLAGAFSDKAVPTSAGSPSFREVAKGCSGVENRLRGGKNRTLAKGARVRHPMSESCLLLYKKLGWLGGATPARDRARS